MDATQILRQLGNLDDLPLDAMRAAGAERASVAPAFVQAIEQYLAGTGEPGVKDALFLVFHLLGEWREKSAYRPLAALLRRPTDEIEELLSDAVTETSHRVMAAVFDGDAAPLYDVIRDPEADESVRSRMCEALAMVTLRGELPREEAARFLRSCYANLQPQGECFAWDGWQSAIAMLGLVELKPLVKRAFERGFISRSWLEFEDFEDHLRSALAHPGRARRPDDDEFTLFGDTIEELSRWDSFSPERDANVLDVGEAWNPSPTWNVPAVNPFKGIGRNDPCPCGSGKKFKKCCLGKAEAPPASLAPVRAAPPDLSWIDDGGDPILEYDPLVEPDPAEWLSLDEGERTALVEEYHRDAGIELPNAKVHAVLHVVVENQIAEGDALPVLRTAERLMDEGLDRHDAIHAIGMVLMGHLSDLLSQAQPASGASSNRAYFAELERLTAKDWLKSG
jgi:hypothetical protein